MPTQHPALAAPPESFLAVDALLPHDLKHLLHPIDDDPDLLSRDPLGWRAGIDPRAAGDHAQQSKPPVIIGRGDLGPASRVIACRPPS
jgi:hypothetical protein